MSVLENSKEKKKVKKTKKQKTGKLVTDETNVVSSMDSNDKLGKKEKVKKNKNGIAKKQKVENSKVTNKKLKKKNKGTKDVKDTQDIGENNSVFAVTEKLLQKKKKQKEKKLQKGLAKKKETQKVKTVDQLEKMTEFFQDLEKDVKGKAKPKWFDIKLKKTVITYLTMVETCDKDPTPTNKTIKSGNQKRLYRFFVKLAKHLGEEIDVVRHWFHTTKKGVLKSGVVKVGDADPSTFKFVFNKKLKAIVKETATAEAPKNSDNKSEAPVWFDEKFAELIKIRNKARRQFKLNPTPENKQAYQLTLKKVKTERKSRKQTNFVSSEPYCKKNKNTNGGKSFGKSSKSGKIFGASYGKADKLGPKPTDKPRGSTPNARPPRNFTQSF